jgi:hypothetical protein
MKKKRLGSLILLGLLSVLAGCVSMYDVRPQVLGTQIQVTEGTRESLRSEKKHVVEVGALRPRIRQFDDLRFVVSLTNRGPRSVLFSPKQIEARLNGELVQAVPYEVQRDRIQRRIDDYRASVQLYYPCCAQEYSYRAGFDYRSFDRLDLQQAYDDLDHLTQYGLRSTEVKPGETVRGEVVLSSRLPAGSVQQLSLEVRVDSEVHAFEFGYLSNR